jgi:hypothetical protein
MTAYGASRPLQGIPTIVSFLNPQLPPSFGDGNRSSCPFPDVRLLRRGDFSSMIVSLDTSETRKGDY